MQYHINQTTRLLILICILGFYALQGMAQTVAFSHRGGFQKEAFLLSLTPSDAGGKVFYTLDGTIPTPENATLYTAPLSITTTTPVSAVCQDSQGNLGMTAVRTYIFLADVYKQPANPKGYPSEWTTGYQADYAMDQSITLGKTYGAMMDDAMMSLPTVCLTTSIPNLFERERGEDTGGIYIFPEEKGEENEWERPASIEYYDAMLGADEGSLGFIQENCGLRIHGGNSRKPGNTPKHSFRVSFRKQYGAGKLKYRIFDDEDAVGKFDHLILRAGYNYSWLKNGSTRLYPQNIVQRTNAQYIVDSWTKEAAKRMGHLITHRRFAHLFINGLYWGLYEISEKIGDKFAAQYLGGLEEEYDIVEDHKGVLDGDRIAFDRMYGLACKATSDNTSYKALKNEQFLDLEQFADYMLLQWYIGNEDWDENNWRAVRNRVTPDRGFQFMVWDAEMGMTDPAINKVTLKKGEPTTMMNALKQNAAFRKIMQQRIETHCLGEGILTPAKAAELYETLCQEIDKAIIGESARWGDYRKMTGETDVTYTRNDYWLPRKEYLLSEYFPNRTATLLKQLEKAGLFDPSIADGIVSLQAASEGSSNGLSSTAYNTMGQRIESAKGYRGIVILGGRKALLPSIGGR